MICGESRWAKNELNPFIRFDTTPACDRHRATGNESALIQLGQCWFTGLVISNAKINIFLEWKIRKQFYQTALGNCYGFKLPKC